MSNDNNTPYGASGQPPRPPEPQPPFGQQGPGQPPQYGQQPPQYGEQPQWGQQPPQYGQQPPQYGEQPSFGQPPGQAPGYGQQPQYGQQPSGQAPQGAPWQAPAYPQGGTPPWQSNYGQGPNGPATVPSAGARLGAKIIDGLIIGIPLAIIGALTGLDTTTAANGTFSFNANNTIWNLVREAIFVCYCAYFYMTSGATPGKKALKLQVVHESTGQKLTFMQGVAREVVLWLSGFLCLVGYFSLFFDSSGRKRGWHDKAASSWVIGR